MAVTALIVGTDESQISATHRALDSQSRPVGTVLIVESLAKASPVIENLPSGSWVWLLQAGMLPSAKSLDALLDITEQSPSATWIAPKLVHADRAREVQEYGLTVTKSWSPISPVSGEFDQSQHDHKEDLLAASAFGSLLRADAIVAAGGLDQRGFGSAGAAGLTNDFRLAIAMRLNGHRVLGAPKARVALPNEASVFAAASALAVKKTQLQLLASYRSPLWLLLGAVFAPLLAVLSTLWLVLVKRPERILASLAAGFWWFANGIKLVLRRPKLSGSQRAGIRALSVLFADREEIQRSQRARVEQPAAIAEANLEDIEDETPRFLASGGLWFMLLLAGASWQFWPKDVALVGGGALPLGDSLARLFSAAGASWQYSGFGLAAPSDPFNWVLFALGAVTFWAPSLSLTLLVFLVKPLAFASAWRLLSLVSRRRGLIVVGALAYAFWPALTAAQQQARIGTLVALILLPLFLFTLARILQFGASPRRSVQTWTWVGISALLAAVISAGAPSLFPLLAVVILLLAIYRFKRIGYLMWIPVPLLVVWLPYAWYLVVGLGHPMAAFADPGVPVAARQFEVWKLLLGLQGAGPFGSYLVFATAVPLAIGFLGVFTRRSLNAMWLWVALAASVATAHVFNLIGFRQLLPAGSATVQEMSPGSPYALIGLEGLIASVLLVIALDSLAKPARITGAFLSLVATLALAGQFVLGATALTWTDGSQMPALVQAQASQNFFTRTLQLRSQSSTAEGEAISAALTYGAGQRLQDLSNAYAYALPGMSKHYAGYPQLAQLTANLVSANGAEIDSGLRKFAIDYVLVRPGENASQLADALDTVPQLEAVGLTDYGRLYRVKDAVTISYNLWGWQWSVTKQVQVAVLGIFALLAIPTRRRQSGRAQDEEELDAFGEGFEGENF